MDRWRRGHAVAADAQPRFTCSTHEDVQKAREWTRQHPNPITTVPVTLAAQAAARARARFFWAAVQSGRLTGAAAARVRQKYHYWFEQFALE